jgi:signal transduction histidine kinase
LHQTAWFYALCATGVFSLIGAYWWLSLRAVRNRYAVVVADRTRVGREIHDTLLQSLGAVGLELEVMASQLNSGEGSVAAALRRLRRQVGECITETRQSIWDLRSPSLERRDLVEAFRALAETAGQGTPVKIEVVVIGRPRPCSLEVQEQLLRIGREAVNNGVRHGQARHIQVTLEYGRNSVSVRVCDDGSGFVPADVPATGHCGLLNMRERAARVRGRFNVISSPGAGTTIEATVPVAWAE